MNYLKIGSHFNKVSRLFLIFSMLSIGGGYAIPTIGTITSNKINLGTGNNFIIVNGLSSDVSSVSASSSNNSILSVSGVTFFNGQPFAVINLQEVGLGTVNISVTASGSGSLTKTFNSISVGNYYATGGVYSAFDLAFWTGIIPFDQQSNNDTITSSLENLPSQNFYSGMTDTYRQTGAGLIATWRGAFIPTQTGYYVFKVTSEGGNDFFKNGGDFEIYSNKYRTGLPMASSLAPNSTTGVFLNSGKPYAFQATSSGFSGVKGRFHCQFAFNGATSIIGSSLTYNDLGNNYTVPVYDNVKPTSPSALQTIRKSNKSIDIIWRRSTDDIQVKGYKVYVNGVLKGTTPSFKDTTYRVSNLTSNQQYVIAVTGYDPSGNESFLSNLLTESTYANESVPPTVPINLSIVGNGDLSVKVGWAASTDASGIFGYKIYLDNVLYNSDTLNATAIILKTFSPLSVHRFKVEAIDGNGNSSGISQSITFTTLGFNPLVISPGIKKTSINLSTKFVGRNEGMGVNASWNDANYLTNTTVPGLSLAVHKELNVGLVRWGTIDANLYSFTERTGSTATNGMSFAKFLDRANKNGFYASITIGTNGNPLIDWRDDPEGTARKFIEYLTGSSHTKQGKKRISEGFAGADTASLLTNCKGLYIEFGNEPWGDATHHAEGFSNYKNYGIWCRDLARAFKSAPGYDSTKITLMYGGRNPIPTDSYGLHEALFGTITTRAAANDTDRVDMMSLSGYLGGQYNLDNNLLTGSSDLQYYKSGIATLAKNLNGLKQTMDMMQDRRGRVSPFFYYETAMTRPDYNKKMGQAIELTDYLVNSLKLGNAFPVLFALGSNSEWAMVDDNGGRFPLFTTAKLFNDLTKGSDILDYSYNSIEKLYDTDNSVINTEPVSMNAFYRNGQYSVILFSRDFENDHQVQINIPDSLTLTDTLGRIYSVTAPDISSSVTSVTSSSLKIFNNMIVTVPKFGMVALTFSGSTIPTISFPVGYTNYRKPTSMSITDGNGDVSDVTNDIAYFGYSSTVVPSDAVNSWTKWQVYTTSNLPLVTSAGSDLIIDATGCFGIGEVGSFTVVGTLFDNPNLSQSRVVNVTSTCAATATKSFLNSLVSIYPNPSKGEFKVKVTEASKVSITNTLGSEITSKNSLANEELTFNGFGSGVYIVKVATSKGTSTHKIVVQ